MSAEIPIQFDYAQSESRIYELWERLGVFDAKVDKNKKPFCVVIPPPNVTGILHMGHMLDNIPQDVMTRWHRMRGFAALWVPGTDHAGIATQNVVKRELAKEGINHKDLGREEFLKRVWHWKEKHGGIIINQLKRLGCSCDWSRERFTMDDGLSRAVLKAFIHLYEKGLIYKGKRIINWCTVCETALANDEVEHETKNSHLWHFRYPIADEKGAATSEHVVVATTRPETMLGDTAVAVNPEDKRYHHLAGKKVILPLQNRLIPVIQDSFVDVEFGTGVVKVTPAHDANDYQAGLKHKLALEVVIGENGVMTEASGKDYVGLDRFEARKRVVADLEKLGLVEKIEKHSHAVGECYRCKSVVEPFVSDQWFVKMRPLAEKAKQAVLDGKLDIVPESEKHDYFHWMDSIQDWCISRQLWWGHRIPIYYCDDCNAVTASIDTPKGCSKCNSTKIHQDEDVLDTWFSSQLWPFSTLGWPEKTEELSFWYPNTWLMSGRDILFFWDARMVMSGLELLGEVPFRTLALHGIVRDEKGRKLSKSLGNSADPLELFAQYGTDAVRAAIMLRYPMGRQDARFGEKNYQEGRALITKLWNASRLLLTALQEEQGKFKFSSLAPQQFEDKWIVSSLSAALTKHDENLSKSDFSHAFESITKFFWDDLCDWYLELIKPRMRAGGSTKAEALSVALHCLRVVLKVLHPYIPFVTEELWQTLRSHGISDTNLGDQEAIALSEWPTAKSIPSFPEASKNMGRMISLVRGVREVRQHFIIAPKVPLDIELWFFDNNESAGLAVYEDGFKRLGFINAIGKNTDGKPKPGFVPFKFEGGVCYVKLPADVDIKETRSKFENKITKLEKGLKDVNARLENKDFVANAPADIVAETKAQAHETKEALDKLRDFVSSL